MSPDYQRAVVMFLLTLLSMFWVGAQSAGADVARDGLSALLAGSSFALPLMAILLAHELGHFFAARIHGVETSPPYFIPMPYSLIGTFGAVIRMPGSIRLRNALFDIGASGPLCGLAVALPVLVYGISTSSVQALDPKLHYISEGHSLLYVALLHALKGAIPAGHDIMLSPPALAGWAGLLVTMINLVPVGQLDGGHVAYALFGERQNVYSRWARRALLLVALGISASSLLRAARAGANTQALWSAGTAGVNWLMWWGVLSLMARFSREEHPPTEPSQLSPGRRVLAWFTLLLFVALFMPTWISMS